MTVASVRLETIPHAVGQASRRVEPVGQRSFENLQFVGCLATCLELGIATVRLGDQQAPVELVDRTLR
ncbi:MAG TPA: hypothetical protein VGC78_06030 [Gaiellaceae bacterium]|jgi:hypothetical protein